MSIVRALRAALEALDGDRTPPGQQPAPVQPPPASSSAELLELVRTVAVKLETLEASQLAIKGYVKEECERAIRAAEAARRAAQRAVERALRGDELEDPGDDVSERDAATGAGERVLPMHGRVASPGSSTPDEGDRLAATRRAVALM